MNSSRLFVLSALNDFGPMHGHQIRHKAQENRTQLWSDVAVGALYGAVGRLQREGLIRGDPDRTSGQLLGSRHLRDH